MPEPLAWHESPFATPDQARLAESLPAALARVVARWPDRPAILPGDCQYSFADLAGRAAGLADQIDGAGLAPGPVALLQSAGLDAVAAWFACGMTGRAFLLLDPSHPSGRLQEMIDAAAASAVLCDTSTLDRLADTPAIRRVIPDARTGSRPLESGLHVDAPAMIFPTSGSTGTPKLVVHSMRTLQARVQASMTLMRVPPAARVVIAGTHASYGFLHHALVFLLSGGSLCLTDVKAGGFPAISRAITRLGARHARFTPSLFRAFAGVPQARESLRALEGVRFSGETLLRPDLDLARRVLDPGCIVQNVYGSTESSLFIWTRGEDADAAGPAAPIGHLYPGSEYAVRPLGSLDKDAGTGELLIRSANHALGDLNAGAIDGKRFEEPTDPAGARVYATGDIVRRLPGGALVVVGRRDRMIKIRGQRVFPAEVENHLGAMPGVTGAAVIAVSGPAGPTLYGFVTRAQSAEPAGSDRAWLARRLPDFMLPSQVIVVPDIPLLPGGKTDSAALRARVPRGEDAAPVEWTAGAPPERLAQAWTALLGPGADALDDDFFALGGDSLTLMKLSAMMERDFGRHLPVEQFLAEPTLAGLARLVGIPAPPRRSAVDRPVSGGTPIRLSHVRESRAPARGIALAMPGWHGAGAVSPFVGAGLFADHDIWSADARINSGTMLADGRWWRVGIEIANHVRSGTMPVPRVLFGYSIGGSIAWLVGRLLAGTAACPEFIVMIDPPPLHRLATHRHPQLDAMLCPTVSAMPAVVHVHRSSLAHAGLTAGWSDLWQTEDNVRVAIGIPTIDHADMIRSDVLALAAAGISAALDGRQQLPAFTVTAAGMDTRGVRMFGLLSTGGGRGGPGVAAILDEVRTITGTDYPPGALYAVLRDGQRDDVADLLEAMIARQPGSRLLRYARYRLDRRPEALRPGNALVDLTQTLPGMPAIEQALAARATGAGRQWPEPFRRLIQLFDMLRAVVAAARHRGARPLPSGKTPGSSS